MSKDLLVAKFDNEIRELLVLCQRKYSQVCRSKHAFVIEEVALSTHRLGERSFQIEVL
jgi:hypothetical protein